MLSAIAAPVLVAGSTLIIGEAVIFIALIGLGSTIIVLKRKENAPAKTAAAPPSIESMYSELQQPNPAAQADPFAGFAGSPQGPPVAPPAAPAAGPAPGTPAGWLPDPSGDPNAIRYWDGSTWTTHVAQRS